MGDVGPFLITGWCNLQANNCLVSLCWFLYIMHYILNSSQSWIALNGFSFDFLRFGYEDIIIFAHYSNFLMFASDLAQCIMD